MHATYIWAPSEAGASEAAGAAVTGADGRQANLLGAVGLATSDRLGTAVELAARQGGSAPAALNALDDYLGGQSIDALRRALGLSHSAAVRLVDRLVQAGLARRRPSGDGRSVAVELTPRGSRTARLVRERRAAALEEVLAPLSRSERAELERLHEKLLAGLTPDRAAARQLCRLCDAGACGHYEGRCPVTLAADAREAERADPVA